MDIEAMDESMQMGGRVERMYLAHARAATRFAYLLTGSREDSEDLTQEAFLRVFARFGSLRREDAFALYLRRTIMNLVRSRFRRERIARSISAASSEVVDDPADAVHDRKVVLAALMRLPVRQRTAIVLRYYEDMTEAQTADVLGCTVAAAKSLVTRAAESLRAELGGIHNE